MASDPNSLQRNDRRKARLPDLERKREYRSLSRGFEKCFFGWTYRCHMSAEILKAFIGGVKINFAKNTGCIFTEVV